MLVAGIASAAAIACPAAAARPLTIPALREWHGAPGAFVLRASSRIVLPLQGGPEAEARTFARDLEAATGRRPPVLTGAAPRPGDLVMTLGSRDRGLGREGYRLAVGPDLRIEARGTAGAFYGTRTVLQLLRRHGRIPAGRARDVPRYPERGLMIDNGGATTAPAWIRREIREMAYLKLNQLHLHFSDNQGFRIESSSHPEIVSARHLTKAQVGGIVRLARRLHIRVIPEIDMPGHLTAALAKHPELQLADAAGERRPDRLDFTLPAARRFARDLILEYLPLFRGRYWHAGADEYLAPADYAGYPQLQRYARLAVRPPRHGRRRLPGIHQLDRSPRTRARADAAGVARRTLRRPRRACQSGRGGGVVGRSRRARPAAAAGLGPPDPQRRLVAHLLRAGTHRANPAVDAGGLRVVAGEPLQRLHREHPGAHQPAPSRCPRDAAAARLRAARVERRPRWESVGHRARHRSAPAAAGPEDLGLAAPAASYDGFLRSAGPIGRAPGVR